MKKVMVLVGGISTGSLNRRFFEAAAELYCGSGGTSVSGNGRAVAAFAEGDGALSGEDGVPSAAENGLEFEVFDIASLPFYSQDLEADPPANVLALRDMAAAADAVLIVTPEYNRSIPGVLKNALDWGSRIGDIAGGAGNAGGTGSTGNSGKSGGSGGSGKNIWARKPTAIMGAAPGAIGTFGAQQHLRNVCSWLDMPVMNQPTVYLNATVGMENASGAAGADGDRLTESSAAFVRKFLAAFEEWVGVFTK